MWVFGCWCVRVCVRQLVKHNAFSASPPDSSSASGKRKNVTKFKQFAPEIGSGNPRTSPKCSSSSDPMKHSISVVLAVLSEDRRSRATFAVLTSRKNLRIPHFDHHQRNSQKHQSLQHRHHCHNLRKLPQVSPHNLELECQRSAH